MHDDEIHCHALSIKPATSYLAVERAKCYLDRFKWAHAIVFILACCHGLVLTLSMHHNMGRGAAVMSPMDTHGSQESQGATVIT
jgi:hypothetical protein